MFYGDTPSTDLFGKAGSAIYCARMVKTDSLEQTVFT